MDDINKKAREIRDLCGFVQGMRGKRSLNQEQKAKIINKAGSANDTVGILSTR